MTRPPWILWRTLFGELWRLLLITTGVVVVVAAFASAVQPLSRGLLSPETAIKYMAFAIPPMLQFALPFAAGFAATLAHHRFAVDNEALAASASGISHRSVLFPAALTGLLLAIVLAGLTSFVIPRFFQRMELTIRRDVAAIVVSRLAEGEAVEIEGRLVRAGRVHRLGPDPSIDAFERLILEDVLMIDFGRDGEVQHEITAARAEAWLRRQKLDGADATVLSIRLLRPVVIAPGQVFANTENIDIRPIAFKHFTRNAPKFLTSAELSLMRANPDLNPEVARRRRTLAGELGMMRIGDSIARELSSSGRTTLIDAGGEPVVIKAGSLKHEAGRWRFEPATISAPARVEVETRTAKGAVRRQAAARLSLAPAEAAADRDGLSLRLEMEGVVSLDGEAGGRADRSLAGLRPEHDPTTDLFAMSTPALLRAAGESAAGAPAELASSIEAAARDLENRARRLRREAMANQHERWSYAVACLVMTLTGAIMALRLRDGMPLTVYLWSFFPSLGAVITIAGGGNMVRANPALGLTVLWAGVAALVACALVAYADLRKH